MGTGPPNLTLSVAEQEDVEASVLGMTILNCPLQGEPMNMENKPIIIIIILTLVIVGFAYNNMYSKDLKGDVWGKHWSVAGMEAALKERSLKRVMKDIEGRRNHLRQYCGQFETGVEDCIDYYLEIWDRMAGIPQREILLIHEEQFFNEIIFNR